MARKRMIDPAIWDSEQVMSLSSDHFKIYIYLISQADDSGRLKYVSRMFHTRIFPLHEVPLEVFTQWVWDLTEIELISLFTDGKNLFISHPNWSRYQTINRPSPSKIPPIEEYTILADIDVYRQFSEYSLNSHGDITKTSITNHGALTPNVKEVKRSKENVRRRHDEMNEPYVPTAERLLKLHLEIDPKFDKSKFAKDFVPNSAKAIRLLVEQDQRPLRLVQNIIEWCKQDEFWAPVIQSGSGLRENFPKLYAQYKKVSNKEESEMIKQGWTLEEDIAL